MRDWIKYLNKMFKANSYTDNGRVKVSLNANGDIVTIKVLDKTLNLIVDGFTDYGLMMEIMKIVETMYNR